MDSSRFHQLVTLDALLQTGSVTLASRRLGLSVPAVSHALARLRDDFGDALLVRAGRQMVLTPRALELREQVRQAVALAEQVFQPPVRFEPATESRTFVLAMTDYVMLVVGRALEQRLAASAPGVGLRISPNGLDDAERLRTGELDLAIGIYGELHPELRTRPLLTDRFVCVVRRGHPATRDGGLSLETWLSMRHVQVAPRGQPGGYVDDLLASMGHTRMVARAVPYFHMAVGLVAESDYVLTVSERFARMASEWSGLQVFEPPVEMRPFTLSMVWHPRFDNDAGHSWLREQWLGAAQQVVPDRHPNARRRLDAVDPTTGTQRKRRPRVG